MSSVPTLKGTYYSFSIPAPYFYSWSCSFAQDTVYTLLLGFGEAREFILLQFL